MTITVTKETNGVKVVYETNSGSASAIVVGESKASVESRVDEIVATHNLKSKATS